MSQSPDLSAFRARFQELERQMAAPDFYADGRRAAAVSREHQKLSRLLDFEDQSRRIAAEAGGHRALRDDPTADSELRELAATELPDLEKRLVDLETQMLALMIPPDPSDSRNTIVEIRAGTGGDEASLFAGDLFRLYSRYAENRGWKIESLSASPNEVGGYKEVIFLVSGDEVFRRLKFESGVHRVQRVPVTEANGRIHTSAATVAVLPEAEEVDLQIDPSDLEITVARASGPGGQGVNTTDSAVQIIHKPTGLIVKCADERSQLKNKAKAFKVLRARLLERKRAEEDAKLAATRRSQVGSGDRSERIRTYNFPQSRVTDHRIGLTLYNLPRAMEGEIDQILDALQEADYKEKIAALAGGPAPEQPHRVTDEED